MTSDAAVPQAFGRAQLLALGAAAAAVYVVGNAVNWAARYRLDFGVDARLWLGYGLFAVFAAVFAATAVLAALRAQRRPLLVATGAATVPVTVAGLVLIPMGVFWMPGLYQIDYELRLFVIESIIETLLFSLPVAGAGLTVAACTLALRGWMRGRRA